MELIIVISILGILAAIAVPKYFSLVEKTREESDETSAAAIARAVSAYMQSEQLTTVPDYSSLPASLVDLGFKFQSIKYGGVDRNAPPQLGGTFGEVTVSGNSTQAYPKP